MPISRNIQRIHLIGIGGIGMSALARYYKMKGAIVSGSDSTKSTITNSLRADGISVVIGHKKSAIKKSLNFVIYNRAIPANNPELVAAQKMGIATLPYAKALGKITETQSTIAITGSHGKSTTTALAALALIAGGFDPTVLIGTNLKEFNGKNFRSGRKPWLVIEADDFGGAFFEYSPTISIVTNVDQEHMDFYKTFANVKNAFLQFMSTTRPGGVLILNHDDKNLRALKSRITAIAKKKSLRVTWYSAKNSGEKAVTARIKKSLKIPGAHNVSNASAIYELGKVLKIPEKKVLHALGSYQGSWRRMEFRGETNELLVYDDYAHHPTEIKASLAAFKEKFPHSPLICVFQPHQIERLRLLFNDFLTAFQNADALVLIPVYQVKGREKGPKSRRADKYTSEALATAIKRKFPRKNVFYLPRPTQIKTFLNREILPLLSLTSYLLPPLLVFMGAGDIVQYTDLIVGKRRTR